MVIYRRYGIRGFFLSVYATLLVLPCFVQADSLYDLLPSKQLKLGHLGFQSKWQSQWLQGDSAYLGGYWDASFPRSLLSLPHHPRHFSTAPQDIGLAAVLRYQRNDGTGFYAEAGTGPQYQSISYAIDGRVHGSRLALNTLAGVGFVWKNGVDLGFKAIYVSRGVGGDGTEVGNRVSLGLNYRW